MMELLSKALSAMKPSKGETVDERSNAYRIEMMAGLKNLGEYYSEPLVFSPNDATVFIIDAF